MIATHSPGATSRSNPSSTRGRVASIAKADAAELDPRRAGPLGDRDEPVRLRRDVHDVGEPANRHAGHLELLPQAGEAEQRLREAAGEHLERDQHADGEVAAPHDQQRAGAQDRSPQQLLERAGERRIRVAQPARGQARRQVRAEPVVVAARKRGLHLQRLDRLDAGEVLGHERLVARAAQELRVETRAEQRRDDGGEDDQRQHEDQRDRRQRRAVDEHQREEEADEGQVEQQRHRRAGEELADGLDAGEPRREHAGRSPLEVAAAAA